ncbi:MAG: sulfurtransferase TusA family protein [Candidatus Lokiarchaeota archaeon]|nr:sulfurtransferase TusA family protein [Candidatus Lokiarchaeota archaeon]
MTEKENNNEEDFNSVLDTRGLFCPEPLFEIRNFSEELEIGECFKVFADDPAAEEDFKRWAKRTGKELLNIKKDGEDLIFYFKKKK